MVITNQLKNQHLFCRAGFGPSAASFEQIAQLSQKSLFKSILKASSKQPDYIDVTDNLLKGMLMMPVAEGDKLERKDLDADQRKELRMQSAQDVKRLNLSWLGQMINSDAQLREKMAIFWHGHFASRNENIFYQQLLLGIIRENALGNFADLLRQVSKSAAIINFLNNNQNKKDHPNENFAREVMELFTIGRGHYTEEDVKEAARAFTGWGSDLQGEFQFRKMQHDYGEKTVLGKTGRFDGDDVLDILLFQKETARFIAKKIYRFFVNDIADEQKVQWLAERFYQSNYDIKSLMEDIFTSEWFYQENNIGSIIKSPVALLVGIRRMLPMQISNEDAQLLVQRVLGQLLFFPPNVAGWPGGRNWIDSSALMFRLRIPQLIYASDEIQLKPKEDDDQQMGMREMAGREINQKNYFKNKAAQVIEAKINWDDYLNKFEKIPRENLTASIAETILQTRTAVGEATLKKYVYAGNREDFIKTTTIQLMSTPEYQLC
jgi:uncharacterized protein (DUF1800 family)